MSKKSSIENIEEVSEPENSEYNDDDIDTEAEQLKISKEFQENVIKYVKLDDLIKKKQSEMSELKIQKKPCEEYIIKYLDNIGENIIEITNGKLRKNKSETKVPLNQEIIKKAIGDKIKDENVVNEILKLMENRPTKTRINLKRTSIRIKKTKNQIKEEIQKEIKNI